MPRIPDSADELAVVYESDGSRIVAFLDPALGDSPLRRALQSTTRPLSSPPAPAAIDLPGAPR
ncbi:hypothetical protein WKI65_43695 [Streptomyces sp. MS1.AVA.3]|uniref:hypothetical protein n=1 Tax=Streptomyces decoyicus TaxID=249567 RepID=UPI0030BDA69D